LAAGMAWFGVSTRRDGAREGEETAAGEAKEDEGPGTGFGGVRQGFTVGAWLLARVRRGRGAREDPTESIGGRGLNACDAAIGANLSAQVATATGSTCTGFGGGGGDTLPWK
jgi:hypothetical protein